MKSNKVMRRPMGQYEVMQRTSDGYFNINALVNQWNSNPNNKRRRLDDFMNSKKTKEFIETLKNDLTYGEKSPKVNNELIKVSKGKYDGFGRPTSDIYVHPFLFIKAAMWINPSFEVQVIKFVYDNLISLRIDAGDNYVRLMKKVYGFQDCDFGRVAIAMNWVVFNEHCKQRRDWSSVEQAQELKQLESTLCSMIDTGLVNSQMELMQVIRKMYEVKYRKF